MKKVELYTDGSSKGNPGPGGYGAILIYQSKEKELAKGYKWTTNNRMELRAVIAGLNALKESCDVTIYTDSAYISNAINKKWLEKWKRNSWRKTDKEKVLNKDLWVELDHLITIHKANFVWVKGHANNKYNNLCDSIATSAASGKNLFEDIGMEK